MFSLESPHGGDSNEFTQYTFFNITKENHPKLFPISGYGIFSKGLKNRIETALVNMPTVFEPLKDYCIIFTQGMFSPLSPGPNCSKLTFR